MNKEVFIIIASRMNCIRCVCLCV